MSYGDPIPGVDFNLGPNLTRSLVKENGALVVEAIRLKAERDQANQHVEQLLEAIEEHRRLMCGGSGDKDYGLPILDRDLYAAAQKVGAERGESK